LHKLAGILALEKTLEQYSTLEDLPDELLLEAKQKGFSDFQIARIIFEKRQIDIFTGMSAEQHAAAHLSIEDAMDRVRTHRKQRGIVPVVKQIDTLAAEYPAQTNYLYMTYNGTENDVAPRYSVQ
jgi:carbamoyl-phosphate synthase large subunit